MKDEGRSRGFTLPELVVAIVIITVATGICLLILRPDNYGPTSRNAKRLTGLALLGQGLKRYAGEHGRLPDGITAKTKQIGTLEGGVDLCKSLVPEYIYLMPFDPDAGGDLGLAGCGNDNQPYTTHYTVVQYIDGSVALEAPLAEQGEKISIRIHLPTSVTR